jgi:hypothetical protein
MMAPQTNKAASGGDNVLQSEKPLSLQIHFAKVFMPQP